MRMPDIQQSLCHRRDGVGGRVQNQRHSYQPEQQLQHLMAAADRSPWACWTQQPSATVTDTGCPPSNYPLLSSPSTSPIYSAYPHQSLSPRVMFSSSLLRSDGKLQHQHQQHQQTSPGGSIPSRDIDRDPLRRFSVKREYHENETQTQAQGLLFRFSELGEEPPSSAGTSISSHHHHRYLAAYAQDVHTDKQYAQQRQLETQIQAVKSKPEFEPEIKAAIRSHLWSTSSPLSPSSEDSDPRLGHTPALIAAVEKREREVSGPCISCHSSSLASFCGHGEAATGEIYHGHVLTQAPPATSGIYCGSGGSDHTHAAYSLAASCSGEYQHQQLYSGSITAAERRNTGATTAREDTAHDVVPHTNHTPRYTRDSVNKSKTQTNRFMLLDSRTDSPPDSPPTLRASASRRSLAGSKPQQKPVHGRQPNPTNQLPFPPVPAVTVPPLPAASSCGTSNIDCYTCRRRRVKCDRQLPLCAKCERTKLECLGYKKPLVWNKGVASRGKMMGKTFPAPATTKNTVAVKKTPAMTTTGKTAAQRKKQQQMKAVATVSPTLPNTPVSPVAPPTPVSIATPRTPAEQETEDDEEDLVAVKSSNCRNSGTAVGSPIMQLSAAMGEVGMLPGELTLILQIPPSQGSPFGHLNPEARFYMQYFEERVARDFVLFDRLSDNPYRHLMPAAAHHPALLNGILAVAARHHSNLTNTSMTKHLPYKGLSFGYLSQDLQRLGTKGILTESTLAVVMLFIFFETLDGGLNTWKIHLRGACRLIHGCLALDSLPENTSAMLRIFMNHVALVDIIGRTLAFSTSTEPVVFDSEIPEFLAVLREGEAYNFLGCPAELLEVIHTITLLKPRVRSTPPHEAPDFLATARALLSGIDGFSADAYVAARSDIDRADSHALMHLVHAYRYAARVYAVETLFPSVTTPDSVATYHTELRRHIGALEDRSLFLKGAVWPVFVAGTGAHSSEERAWTREQLGRLWEVLPQGNIKSAGMVLEDMWERGDRGGERGWRLLEQGGKDWLFV